MEHTIPHFNKTGDDCAECPIQHRAVCAYCEKSELIILNAMKSYRTYSAGDPIILAGDNLNFVGSVVTGHVRLSQTMEDGRRQLVGLLLPSDFIGRPGRSSIKFDIEATTNVTLCCFDRAPFEKLLHEMPHLRERMLDMALDELDSAREWMVLLGRKTAREKIASLLMIFAKRQLGKPTDSSVEVNLGLTREAMSEYLGLTLETVSRQFSALKRDGVITLQKNRNVLIHDVDQLLAETGESAEY
jgi:CRP/FNR family transcriptional regulator